MMLVAKLGLQLACDIQRLAVTEKDAFDLWWEWADKPVDNKPTIDAAIYDAVMALPPDERRDRTRVNEAVRDGLRRGPLRPAGSADQFGVPKATE